MVYCIGKHEGREFKTRRANAGFFFFSCFSLWRAFSFFFPQEANKCFQFMIIYYFARYSCIACIMLLKPRSPRSFCNLENKCFLGFFKTIQIRKCSHHKLLTYIAEIYLIIISLCFTFAEPFVDIFQVVHWVSGNTNKRLRPKEGRNERLSERPSQ